MLDIFTYTSLAIMTLYIIGYINSPPELFVTYSFIIKVIISLILIYKFGYKKTKTYTEIDRRIIIMISIFMLIMSFTDIINEFLEEIKQIINPNYVPNKNGSSKWIK